MHTTPTDTPIDTFTELLVAQRDRDKAQSEVRALRSLLADAERDGRAWCEQLGEVQKRCSELTEETRAARRELAAVRASGCDPEFAEPSRPKEFWADAERAFAEQKYERTAQREPKSGWTTKGDEIAAAAPDRPVTVTSDNARDLFGHGSVRGEGLHEALKPGGVLDAPPVTIVKADSPVPDPFVSDLILKCAALHDRQQSRIDTLTSSLEHLLLQEASTEDGLGLGWECVGCVDHGFVAPVSSPEEIEHVPGCPLFTTENDHG